MKKGILFIAPLGARDKKKEVFNEILSLCPEGDYSPVLYITPSVFGQAEAKRQFFSYLKTNNKKTAYIPFQAIPLKQLCINLYETLYASPLPPRPRSTKRGRQWEGARGRVIISSAIEPLLICEILGGKNLGYAVLLSELLYKLRHYILNKDLAGIKEEIRTLIFEEKAMRQAVNALQTLDAYEKLLDEKGLIDYESALKESIQLIKNQNSEEIQNKTEMLVLDGFFDPTPLESEVIMALIEKTGRVCVLIEENAAFLNFFESYADKFEKKMLSPSHRRENTVYYTYPSMEDEAEGIAKGAKALILEGTKPWEIIAAFPSIAKYLPMLKRVFKKHGIPLSAAECDLSNARPVAAVTDMVASIENDYPRNEFLSFVTSPHFPKIPEAVREWAVVYSGRAGIIKGRDAWLSIKDFMLNAADEEITEDQKNHISKMQNGIRQVIEALEKIRRAKDISSFVGRIEDALDEFGFLDAASTDKPLLDAVNNQLAGLKRFSEISGSKIKGIQAGNYLRHLLNGLKGIDENKDGVRVLSYELAAGLQSKAIFIGGMVEGEFPAKPPIDPILPEKVKKALGMPYLEYYLDRQRRYFKRLLNVSERDPYVSYPSADSDKIFLPSPFLDWGEGIAPPVLNISSAEEILIAEGLIRQKDFAEALWDGRLPAAKELGNILRARFGERFFISVTDIDSYRKCPLRFYIEKVLGFEIEKPPRFEVEAMRWGMLAHKVMEYLYEEGMIEIENINERIMQGLREALKSREIGTIDGFWSKVAEEIFLRLIPAIKEQEAEIRMTGFNPYAAERRIKTEVNGIRLKGKIDRIDRREGFKDSRGQGVKNSRSQTLESSNPRILEPFSVILLDYKTGLIDKDSLQLPLYAAMWQKEHGDAVEKAGYYSLKDGRIEWFPKKMSMEEFIETALQEAGEIAGKMKDGIFEPAPFKDTECRYCNHSALCREAR